MGGSGVVVNVYQPAVQGKATWFVAFAHFCGVNTPPWEISNSHLDVGVGKRCLPWALMNQDKPVSTHHWWEERKCLLSFLLSSVLVGAASLQDCSSRQQCLSGHSSSNEMLRLPFPPPTSSGLGLGTASQWSWSLGASLSLVSFPYSQLFINVLQNPCGMYLLFPVGPGLIQEGCLFP